MLTEKILLKGVGDRELSTLAGYERHGGYESLKKAVGMTRNGILEELKRSGMRGRGGAGFPAHKKWANIPETMTDVTPYLVCNADEAEPGAFKDRFVMERNPHALVEGMIITCMAIGARQAFCYIRGEFPNPYEKMRRAIGEAEEAGYAGKNILGSGMDIRLTLFSGAGAYICGEASALMSSIEGFRGFPRIKPPRSTVHGLYACPTVVNNVETIAYVPYIVLHGGEKYSSVGDGADAGNRGLKLFCISGHVKRPGVYEEPMGITLRSLIEECAGGVRGDGSVYAVMPGGPSTPILTSGSLDAKLDFDSMRQAGSELGGGEVIVMDHTTCLLKVVRRTAEFFMHESCGQCPQCREGTKWMVQILRRIELGDGHMEDLDLLLDICRKMSGRTICTFTVGAATPVISGIERFRDEFEMHVREKRCLNAN